MEKLFLTSNEVADLLNISQQQAYKIIRDMNKQLAEHGFLILRGRINKKYFMEQIYKAKEGEYSESTEISKLSCAKFLRLYGIVRVSKKFYKRNATADFVEVKDIEIPF